MLIYVLASANKDADHYFTAQFIMTCNCQKSKSMLSQKKKSCPQDNLLFIFSHSTMQAPFLGGNLRIEGRK